MRLGVRLTSFAKPIQSSSLGFVFATSGLSNLFAAAFDSAGNFNTENYFEAEIRKLAPDGAGSTFAFAPNAPPHFMAFVPGPSPITRITGFATPITGDTGNFTQLFMQGLPIIPSIDGNNVAFFGAGSGDQLGI